MSRSTGMGDLLGSLVQGSQKRIILCRLGRVVTCEEMQIRINPILEEIQEMYLQTTEKDKEECQERNLESIQCL
jgi:hypothetical protein